jgi:hypothetical protein
MGEMIERIPCKTPGCERTILPSTAEKTGGFCMPCARGERPVVETTLSAMPEDARARELWMQHGAGYILFQDMRQFAIDRIPKELDEAHRALVIKGIDDAVYGMMMILDGVTGSVWNKQQRLSVAGKIVLENRKTKQVIEELAFPDGDGMCLGYHDWMEGKFGKIPPVNGVKPAD